MFMGLAHRPVHWSRSLELNFSGSPDSHLAVVPVMGEATPGLLSSPARLGLLKTTRLRLLRQRREEI